MQDFGPFPIIGCDSESLCWLFNDGDVAENFARDDSGEVLGEVALVGEPWWYKDHLRLTSSICDMLLLYKLYILLILTRLYPNQVYTTLQLP